MRIRHFIIRVSPLPASKVVWIIMNIIQLSCEIINKCSVLATASWLKFDLNIVKRSGLRAVHDPPCMQPCLIQLIDHYSDNAFDINIFTFKSLFNPLIFTQIQSHSYKYSQFLLFIERKKTLSNNNTIRKRLPKQERILYFSYQIYQAKHFLLTKHFSIF